MNQPGLRCTKREERYAECKRKSLTRVTLAGPKRANEVTKKRDHITPVLRKLHWLTIDKRIVFKVLIITYKVLHGLSPKYISDLLTLKRSSRILRSNYQDSLKLETPTFKTKNYGGKAFSVCAPRLWNDLPRDLRNSPSLETFKRGLKTYLFNQ